MANGESEMSPEMRVFRSGVITRRSNIWGGALALIAASVALALIATDPESAADATFRFIALLIIFLTALATCAAIFSGLGLGNAAEAFGLPIGSVRALLALGIMILFVVFGLPLVSSQRLGDRITDVSVPKASVERSVERYREQGLVAIVVDEGTDDTSTATGAIQPGRQARLRLYTTASARTPEQLEFSKQLITAIITLLTTVIGFYFGSRSATEAARELDNRGLGLATALAVERQGLEDRFGALKRAITEKGQVLDSGAQAPAPEDEAQASERQAALARAQATRQLIEARRDEIARLLESADQALSALIGGAAADARQLHERNARESIARASELITALEQAAGSYADEVEAFVQASAEG